MPAKDADAKQTDGAARQHQMPQQVQPEQAMVQDTLQPADLQRAIVDPTRAGTAGILGLQRVAGNRAVSHLIQAKLTVGGAGDRYEQEADRVAEQVMSSQQSTASSTNSRSTVQRQAPEEEEVQTKPLAATITPVVQRAAEEEEEVQTKSLVQRQEDEEEIQTKSLVQRQEDEEEIQTKSLVQRQEDEEEIQTKSLLQRQEEEEEIQTKPLLQRQEEEEEIQTKPLLQRQEEEEEIQTKPLLQRRTNSDGSFEAGRHLESRLAANRGTGSPLPESVRSFMEPRFGADFSEVRIHTGGEAVQMNREIQAQAFTHGQDIYMGTGAPAPGTEAGSRLLAHELTHVIQQNGASNRIARWGGGMSGYGTSHTAVSHKAFAEMPVDLLFDFGGTSLDYLADHSDHMDKRLGYLIPVGLYMFGQSRTKSKKKGMYAGSEMTGKQLKKKVGKKGMSLDDIQGLIEEEKRERARQYDQAVGYNRNPAEAPNHAEGGMYKNFDGEGRDRGRIEEYLSNAVDQWNSGNPHQSMYTLALALHTAQDIGAHGHGAPGTGHDPRRFFPPPNE
jgi:chemotaxis protein histidine kinase CheA